MAIDTQELLVKWAKTPKKIKAMIGGAVCILLGVIYWQLLYAPRAAEYQSLRIRHEALVDEEQQLLERKKQYLELLKRKLEVEDELRRNAVKLPASSELPAFFVHLQAQAVAANVKVVKWTRDTEVPVETYIKVPVKLEVQGDFYQLTHYFKLIYETPRIITIENLVMGNPKMENDRTVLTASFVASTFRQADRPPRVGVGAEEAPK